MNEELKDLLKQMRENVKRNEEKANETEGTISQYCEGRAVAYEQDADALEKILKKYGI